MIVCVIKDLIDFNLSSWREKIIKSLKENEKVVFIINSSYKEEFLKDYPLLYIIGYIKLKDIIENIFKDKFIEGKCYKCLSIKTFKYILIFTIVVMIVIFLYIIYTVYSKSIEILSKHLSKKEYIENIRSLVLLYTLKNSIKSFSNIFLGIMMIIPLLLISNIICFLLDTTLFLIKVFYYKIFLKAKKPKETIIIFRNNINENLIHVNDETFLIYYFSEPNVYMLEDYGYYEKIDNDKLNKILKKYNINMELG